jgi:hypothetical protein
MRRFLTTTALVVFGLTVTAGATASASPSKNPSIISTPSGPVSLAGVPIVAKPAVVAVLTNTGGTSAAGQAERGTQHEATASARLGPAVKANRALRVVDDCLSPPLRAQWDTRCPVPNNFN